MLQNLLGFVQENSIFLFVFVLAMPFLFNVALIATLEKIFKLSSMFSVKSKEANFYNIIVGTKLMTFVFALFIYGAYLYTVVS